MLGVEIIDPIAIDLFLPVGGVFRIQRCPWEFDGIHTHILRFIKIPEHPFPGRQLLKRFRWVRIADVMDSRTNSDFVDRPAEAKVSLYQLSYSEWAFDYLFVGGASDSGIGNFLSVEIKPNAVGIKLHGDGVPVIIRDDPIRGDVIRRRTREIGRKKSASVHGENFPVGGGGFAVAGNENVVALRVFQFDATLDG